MSVIPFPRLLPTPPTAPADAGTPTKATSPLQLVAPHEHAWQLRAVEYDEALEVRRYECATCEDVLFR